MSAEVPREPDQRAYREAETRLLPLVEKLAKREINRGLPMPLEDLIQVGAIAVWKALPRFDPSRAKVETWLTPRIVGAFKDHARQYGRLLSGGQRTKRVESIQSLDQVMYETDSDHERTMQHVLEDKSAVDPMRGRERLNDALRGLSKVERIAVTEYFVSDQTMKSIAEGVGISESRVSQLMKELYARLRKRFTRSEFAEAIG